MASTFSAVFLRVSGFFGEALSSSEAGVLRLSRVIPVGLVTSVFAGTGLASLCLVALLSAGTGCGWSFSTSFFTGAFLETTYLSGVGTALSLIGDLSCFAVFF